MMQIQSQGIVMVNRGIAENKKTERENSAHRNLSDWSDWVNSDSISSLGYPSQAAASANIYNGGIDDVWRAKAKNTRCANVALPDWRNELLMDGIVRALNIELRRVIYCQYQVRLDGDELIACRIPIRRMNLLGHDGRYSWPKYRLPRIEALSIPERTYYRSLGMAIEAVMTNRDFYLIK